MDGALEEDFLILAYEACQNYANIQDIEDGSAKHGVQLVSLR